MIEGLLFYYLLYRANRQARKARQNRSHAMRVADTILMTGLVGALGLTILAIWLTS